MEVYSRNHNRLRPLAETILAVGSVAVGALIVMRSRRNHSNVLSSEAYRGVAEPNANNAFGSESGPSEVPESELQPVTQEAIRDEVGKLRALEKGTTKKGTRRDGKTGRFISKATFESRQNANLESLLQTLLNSDGFMGLLCEQAAEADESGDTAEKQKLIDAIRERVKDVLDSSGAEPLKDEEIDRMLGTTFDWMSNEDESDDDAGHVPASPPTGPPVAVDTGDVYGPPIPALGPPVAVDTGDVYGPPIPALEGRKRRALGCAALAALAGVGLFLGVTHKDNARIESLFVAPAITREASSTPTTEPIYTIVSETPTIEAVIVPSPTSPPSPTETLTVPTKEPTKEPTAVVVASTETSEATHTPTSTTEASATPTATAQATQTPTSAATSTETPSTATPSPEPTQIPIVQKTPEIKDASNFTIEYGNGVSQEFDDFLLANGYALTPEQLGVLSGEAIGKFGPEGIFKNIDLVWNDGNGWWIPDPAQSASFAPGVPEWLISQAEAICK